MVDGTETDTDGKVINKSDDSAKFDKSFGTLEVFQPPCILNTSSEMPGWSRKIRLEQKSMEPKFDVEVKNDEKCFFFGYYRNDFFSFLMIIYDVRKLNGGK